MPHVLPISLLRAALGVVLAAAVALANLAPPAPAASTPVTVRIEGLNATILPETGVATDTRTLPTEPSANPFCSGDGSPVTVNGATAIGVLADAAGVGAFTYGISNQFDFGLLVCRIAGESGAPDGSSFWLYKVNQKSPSVGGDQYQLGPGDRVLWYMANADTKSTLDVSVATRAAVGSSVAVSVTTYDNITDVPSPAVGATVTVGSKSQTTDEAGSATLVPAQPGNYQVAATKTGAVRSPTYTVCVYDPALGGCDTTPVTAAAAPSAKITKPVDGRIYGKIREISGSLAGNLADARTVRLRVKRIRQRRCTRWHDGGARFASAKQRLRSTSCAKPGSFDVPLGAGGKWSYRFRKTLAPGVYSVNARAVDSAGNVEAAVRDRVNRVSFAVRHEQRAKKG